MGCAFSCSHPRLLPTCLLLSGVLSWDKEAGKSFTLPLPHSELLEDLEGCNSAGGIAECFVQRVSRNQPLRMAELGTHGAMGI